MSGTVLLTGNCGYIGAVMTKFFVERSYKVVGLDSRYYIECDQQPCGAPVVQIAKDIRDLAARDLDGVDAVIHLAGLSNDPLGELRGDLTREINLAASVALAKLAKQAHVPRYVFASSCSVYGIASNEAPLDESSLVNPITEYAKSKALVEQEVGRLADAGFHPTFMRNATAYGYSPSLRLDLVVNNLVAWGYLTGKIAIMSDGTPWRPIVHVEDICRSVLAVLQAPADKIHNECFNVGRNEENFQVRDIAEMVKDVVPGCKVDIRNTSSSDERTYRVDFSKFADRFPESALQWTLRRGVEELYAAYQKFGLAPVDLESTRYFRVRWIRQLIQAQRLDSNLRWRHGDAKP